MTTISIMVNVDVVGALCEETLTNNIYLIDNNGANGSTHLGTDVLKTKVEKGDTLLWNVMAIEPEAYASITEIGIDSNYCKVEQKTYEGSDVAYWVGTVLKALESVPDTLRFALGSRVQEMTTSERPTLIGADSQLASTPVNQITQAGS